MFKVISAELKKMISKPGVYVLAIFLALILILGVFIYHPTVYENTYTPLVGNTVTSKYSSFYVQGSTDRGEKAKADALITTSSEKINNYYIYEHGTPLTYKEKVNSLKEKLDSAVQAYQECQYKTVDEKIIEDRKNNVINLLDELKNVVKNGIDNSRTGSYTILTTNKNYDSFIDVMEDATAQMKSNVDKNEIADFCEKYYFNNYEHTISSCLSGLKYPTISDALIETYTTTETNTRLNIVQTRLKNVFEDINSLFDEVNIDSTKNSQEKYINEMDRLANLYIGIASDFSQLIKYELLSNAFSYVGTTDQIDLMYLNSESEYNSKTNLIKYNYLFEHNKTNEDFAHPLTIGVTSNHSINAYDYAYFSLKLFSFIIIVYAVMSACYSIAGEIKEGSMRYYAIRPVTRSNVYWGKMLAILIMSIIFIIFSGIIALAVGGAVYGFGSANILTIFNSSIAITFHPIVMILIFMLSLLLEIIVYTSIAMLLSCLFKSDLLAITLILVLYLINILLPVFVRGANSWITFYPFSHISLYALFGSSIYAMQNNFVNLLLGAKIYAGSNIILTLCIILVLSIVLNAIAVNRFKKKEL